MQKIIRERKETHKEHKQEHKEKEVMIKKNLLSTVSSVKLFLLRHFSTQPMTELIEMSLISSQTHSPQNLKNMSLSYTPFFPFFPPFSFLFHTCL